jgi:formylglycine-generating enzyme
MIRHVLAGSIFVSMIACLHCQTETTNKQEAVSTVECSGESCPMPTVKAEVERKVEEVGKEVMALVSGNYCTRVEQACEVWKDNPSIDGARCQKYKPSVCVGKLVPMSFYMDVDEYTAEGEILPTVNVDAYQAKTLCAKEGKRLCKEDEFNFACEGEQMFPYTTGLERPDGVCNIDVDRKLLGRVGHLNDLRKPSASLTECISPFFIRNLNGNVGEVVIRNVSSGRYSIALKSGWWSFVRNRCRPATVAHSELYSGAESGFRCCSDIQ